MVKTGCLFALVVGLAGAARADSLRCPKTGKFVEVGDRSSIVEAKCGPPDSREPVFGATCGKSLCTPKQVGEFWRYDLGYTKLVRLLHFRYGILVSIETGTYGTKGD